MRGYDIINKYIFIITRYSKNIPNNIQKPYTKTNIQKHL